MNPELAQQEVRMFMTTEDGTQVELGPMAKVEVVRTEAPVPEAPKNHWEEVGFLAEIARIANDLEGEPEQFIFSAEIRQIIETITNATEVEDFDRYTDAQLYDFASQLRRRVPQVEREVMTFISQLTRARAVAVDAVDFI